MRNAAFPLKYLVVLALIVLFSSCSVWDTFTAFFNTYYNARKVYDEAQAEVWLLPEMKDTGRNLLVNFTTQQGTRTKFTSVIEKCSKLLQYHPESNLVDDALLMVGKSYFYQNEFQKAERKFKELIDGYPSSNLELETRLMLAITYFKMNDRTSATTVATQLVDLAGKAGDRSIVAGASLVLAQIELESKNYLFAREFFTRAGEMGDTSEKQAQAFLKVAEMYALEKDFASAELAYRKAGDLSTVYTGDYRGRIGAARMLARQGKFDVARAELFDLRKNVNFREFFGEVDVEIGHVYRDSGELEAAIDQYRYVDSLAAYARTEFAGNAQYALGQLYEKKFGQYDSARVFYDRGRSTPPQAEVTPLLIRRADILGKFLNHRAEIVKLDSMRRVLLEPRDTAAVARDTTVSDTTGRSKSDSAADRMPVSPPLSLDTVDARLADRSKSDSAAVRVPVSPPLSLDNVTARLAGRSKSDSAAVRVPVSPPLSLDTVNVRLAGHIDELAGLFYTGLGLPDSARWWYRRLLADFPESRVAPRALYVLARIEAEDSTGTPGSADSLYREILRRFPSSPFADEARRLLGLPAVQKTEDAAEVSYTRGVSLMQSGNYLAAIDTFKAIASRHSISPVASRALYAVGWIYEYNTTHPDSAAANYESLVTRFPSSVYAVRVQPRVAAIQAVRSQALDKARADSIAAQAPVPTPTRDKAKADSSAAQAPVPQPPPVENKPAQTVEDPEDEIRRAKKPVTPPDPDKKKPSETPDAEPTW